jgi:hypothetical protein
MCRKSYISGALNRSESLHINVHFAGHHRIPINPKPSLICFHFSFDLSLFSLFLLNLYVWLGIMEGISNFPTWDMEDVNVLYKKVFNIGSHSFQPI